MVAVGKHELIDGTAGEFPHRNTIARNHIHEIGLIGKQVAGYFQSIAGSNIIKQNVIYNGPRVSIPSRLLL